jgi:hypothetical protein
MALILKNYLDGLLRSGSKATGEQIAEWLGKVTLKTRPIKEFSRYLVENFGALSEGLRTTLGIMAQAGIGIPVYVLATAARRFRISPALATKVLEESLDRYIETVVEGLGIEFNSEDDANAAIKGFSSPVASMKFAVARRERDWYEVHTLDCEHMLVDPEKTNPDTGEIVAEATYIEGVKVKPLPWIIENCEACDVPRCCERDLPGEVRLLIRSPSEPVPVAPKAEELPAKTAKVLQPLALVLAEMRVRTDTAEGSRARFFENLMRQAEQIEALDEACKLISDRHAFEPVWSVQTFMSTLNRAIGISEDGNVSTVPPPAGVNPLEHTRNLVITRVQRLERAMSRHVLACESRGPAAIADRIFMKVKRAFLLQGETCDSVAADVATFATGSHTRAEAIRKQTRERRAARYGR